MEEECRITFVTRNSDTAPVRFSDALGVQVKSWCYRVNDDCTEHHEVVSLQILAPWSVRDDETLKQWRGDCQRPLLTQKEKEQTRK